jgi:branched-chain amino acid transport system substrate-binding protein
MSGQGFSALAATFLIAFAASNAQAEIQIGVAAPLTGHYAWAGEQTRVGSIKAVEDLNARGGVLGEQRHHDDVEWEPSNSIAESRPT